MFTASSTEGEEQLKQICHCIFLIQNSKMHLDEFHIIYSLRSCLNWKCLSLIQACVHKPPYLDIIHCL